MTIATGAAPGHAPLAAACWMLGAVAAFTAMAVAGRAVSLELDTFEIMGWRSLIGAALLAVLLSVGRRWSRVRHGHAGLHLGRNVAHFAAQNLWFHAIAVLPLAQVFALEFTAPLWVLILSPLLLGERLTRARAMATGLGFVGSLLVVRPGAAPFDPALFAAAGCAVGFAFTYMITRRLTAQAPTLAILWWMTASQTAMGFGLAALDGAVARPSADALPWVALIALSGLTAHYCIASALRRAPAIMVMPVDFLRLPVIALIGLLLFGEPAGPWVILGGVLILGGNWLNLRAEARRR